VLTVCCTTLTQTIRNGDAPFSTYNVISDGKRKFLTPSYVLIHNPISGYNLKSVSAQGSEELNLNDVDIRWSNKFQDRFNLLNTMPACDKQTDRQTDTLP